MPPAASSERAGGAASNGTQTATLPPWWPRALRPEAGSPGTWITPEMQAAYCRLYDKGLAHSYEIWRAGRMIGGVYGVRLGRVFFGESMFSPSAMHQRRRSRDWWITVASSESS